MKTGTLTKICCLKVFFVTCMCLFYLKVGSSFELPLYPKIVRHAIGRVKLNGGIIKQS